MAISVADNFSYQGTKPLDARVKYASVSEMKNVSAATLYDGILAYVTGTKKYYTYDSTNETDPDTGKWREFESGGSGGEGGHTIEDYEGTALTQRDTLKFDDSFDISDDSTNEKTVVSLNKLTTGEMDEILDPLPYVKAPGSGYRGDIAFTPVGTIISVMSNTCPVNYLTCNGQTVNIIDYPELANHFEREFGSKNYFGGDGTTTFAVPDLRGEFLRGAGTNSHTNQGSGSNVGTHQDATVMPYEYVNSSGTNAFRGRLDSNGSILGEKFDSIYRGESHYQATVSGNTPGSSFSGSSAITTRPTNTSVFYCIAIKNIYIDGGIEYSDSEKMVGRWIDGKPIYQKTIFNTISCDTNLVLTEKSIDISSLNVDKMIDIKATNLACNMPLVIWNNYNNITYVVRVYYDISNGNLVIAANRKANDGQDIYITIQYTKTTD